MTTRSRPSEADAARSATRFIVLGDARTGSNMLCDALNSHTEIVCFREVLNFVQDFIDYGVAGYDPRDPADFALRRADPAQFLRERIFGGHGPEVRCAGFKLHYAHIWGFDPLYEGLFERVLEALVRDTALQIVHLQRRNQLRSLVSLRLAQATGVWMEGFTGGARQPLARSFTQRIVDRVRGTAAPAARRDTPRTSIVITPEDCAAHFERVASEIDRFNAMFEKQRMLSVCYEDLVSSSKTLEDIERFLGVRPAPLTVALRRQNPQPLSELISNFDDLRAAFAHTPQRTFFEGSG